MASSILALGVALGMLSGCTPTDPLASSVNADLARQSQTTKRLRAELAAQTAKAEQGDAEAQLAVAQIYFTGKGVDVDHVEAARWFEMAAKGGNAEAAYRLGLFRDYGLAAPAADPVAALPLFTQAADAGHLKAQLHLAAMLDEGRGVPRDAAGALERYEAAANQGDLSAQMATANKYALGDGVATDPAAAARWYRAAADQNSALAQYNLGFSYEQGSGVPRDFYEAERWYRSAAEQGLADAQFALGSLYSEGEGERYDPFEAYKWVFIASQDGYPGALKMLQGLQRDLNARDRENAESIARDWMARHAKKAPASQP